MSIPHSSSLPPSTVRVPELYDYIIFVARGSIYRGPMGSYRGESDAQLHTSLRHTRANYEQVYGPIMGICEFHTFAWPSYEELPPDVDTVSFFDERLANLDATFGNMMVVINGWDGLTSHAGSFNRLFRAHAPQVTLRVFANQPRSFYQVNVVQIFQLFDGHILINPYLDCMAHEQLDEGVLEILNQMENQLEYSTGLFYRYFRAFGTLRIN
ncbi:hypothetical protein F1880_000808 [Penicillium rolfsii]|nr:hypothetical protein F1880_000808 [Penicillium rolfsii]